VDEKKFFQHESKPNNDMTNRVIFKIVYIIVNIVLFIYNPVNPKIIDIIFSRVAITGRSFIDFPLLHFIPMTEMYMLNMILNISMIELKYIL
jgi:hypothetical protein